VAQCVRRGAPADLLRFVRSSDATDLREVDRAISRGAGTVLALPHYGHYILCAVSLIMHIGSIRDVGIFYGEPTTHRGNEVFDRLYEALFKGRNSNVHVYHTGRQGMAGALRLLKAGGVLIMMPDVHQKRDETFAIPFLGHSLDVMLGTAALARKTGSALVPVLPLGTGPLRFRTEVGCPVKIEEVTGADGSQRECFLDYAATCAVFDWYQRWMRGTCIQWQYVREHFARRAPFVELAPDVVERVWNDFFNDPRVRSSDDARAFRLALK
jgi:lauroyl/myristoyl acyltransferase